MKQLMSGMILAALIAVGGWWAWGLPEAPRNTGNPRDAVTPEAIGKEARAKQEVHDIRQARQRWFERIEAGDATFEEAACAVERDGYWDDTTSRCIVPSPYRLIDGVPPKAPPK